MNRLPLGIALGVTLAAAHAHAAEKPGPPPNIVLILADDMGWGDVGYNGRKDWPTPHINRLAAQGMRFDRWYTGAVVCAPSRAVLLTGKYTIHNGVTGNSGDLSPAQITIAGALRERGYATGVMGKWHTGRPRPPNDAPVHPLDLGFDEYIGIYGARECWEKFPREMMFGRALKPVEGHTTRLFTDHALEFIDRHADRPFFLYLPYTDPHFHVAASPEDVARYRGKFEEIDPSNPVNATYAAMMERLDAEIGRVLRRLEERGLSDNTIVIFTSDHGATFESGTKGAPAYHDSNRPFRGQKRTLWEGGLRVPGIVRWPARVASGSVCDRPVHMMDLFPTLVAAAGGEAHSQWGLDGANLLNVWLSRAEPPARTLFWEWRSEGRDMLAAMRDDLKLVKVCTDGRAQLYDVVRDPAERIDLLAAHSSQARELESQLTAWLKTEQQVRLTRTRPGE